MQAEAVPKALRDRLGADGTEALLELLDRAFDEQRDSMIASCADRFERRVVEEISGLRVQGANSESTLRQAMGKLEAGLRQDTSKLEAGLRQDMGKLEVNLRQDMMRMESGLRQEIATNRVELLKWSFLFWVGQVLAITAIIGVMLRLYHP